MQKIYLQKMHGLHEGLHELGSRIECNDTLHGSELGPHWVLDQKIQIWSHGTKIFGSKISLCKVIQVPWRYFVGF